MGTPPAPARPPAGRGRGCGRGRAGGGVVGAAACGVVRGGGTGWPRRGGTMELGAQPRRRRRHRGPVSAGCGRPGSPVPAPSLLGSGPRGCPGGGQARAGPPQPRGEVKLLHRAWCARAGGGAHCGPRRRPAACLTVRLHPSCWLPSRPRLPAVAARRPSSPARSPGPPAAALPVARYPAAGQAPAIPAAGGAGASAPIPTHDAGGCPASGTFTSLPASRASPAFLPAPRARRPVVQPSPSSASPSPRLCAPGPPAPGAPSSRAAGPRGSRPRQRGSALRPQGTGSGSRRGARRRTGDKASRLGAALPGWIVPGRLSCARRRGPRRLALAPPPRQSFSEWKTFSSPSVILTDNGDFFLI